MYVLYILHDWMHLCCTLYLLNSSELLFARVKVSSSLYISVCLCVWEWEQEKMWSQGRMIIKHCAEMKYLRVTLNISVTYTYIKRFFIPSLNFDSYIKADCSEGIYVWTQNQSQASGGFPYDNRSNLFSWAQVPGQEIKLLIWILGWKSLV